MASAVAVHDIDDIEGFVKAIIVKTKLKIYDSHEREELVAEGMAILLHLASIFKPHMEGYENPGSFAGYCSRFLPKKITTAYFKMHPEHLLETTTDEHGKQVKRYVFGDAPASWDEQVERDASVDCDSLRTPGNFVRS